MARWKLTEVHYILTDPPTEWEQKEVDLDSGEEVRHRYEVPRLLNPDFPGKKGNYPEAIVCLKGKGLPSDIVMKGAPTPSMVPLDAEAEEISARLSRGQHPIESLPSVGEAPPDLLRQMQAQINALMMANDELQRRVAANEGDVLKDLEDLASQRPKVAPDQTKPTQRRV